jgi:hypothetical protein
MKKLILIFIIALSATRMSAQQLAVGTNVLMDALMIPNISLEMSLGRSHTMERTVLLGQAYFLKNPWGHEASGWGVQPEVRYFFSGRAMSRWFFGAGIHFSKYNLTWGREIYDGNSAGAGLTFGYVFNITERLNIDAHSGFGINYYRQKQYFAGDFYDKEYYSGMATANARGMVLMPTRMGISITYILK